MQTPVILIVEDEEVTRLNLVSLFQGEGYDVIEAVNGEEMNQKLTDNKVNLVVCTTDEVGGLEISVNDARLKRVEV